MMPHRRAPHRYDAGMEPTIVDVASADGHRAGLVLHEATAARAGLLWLPAMGVPARKYSRFAGALAERGVATALHEWRGGGSSDWRAGRDRDWGYAELLADVAASRDALARRDPAVAWRIGGHSLGAQLAALAHAREPSRYAGIAIVGAGLPYWRSFPAWQRPLLLAVFAWFRLLVAALGYFPGDTVGFAGREARRVIRDWTRSGLSGRYRIEGDALDHDAALAALATPVFAVRFAHDRYVPAGSLDALLARMPRATVARHALGPARFAQGRADHFAWMRDTDPVVHLLADWATGGPG